MTEAATTAAEFARLGRDLLADPDEYETMQRIVDTAVRTIPACDLCSISLRVAGRRVMTPVSTDPIVNECDELQYELREGPCVGSIWEQESYIIEDTRNDSRFPNWGPKVAVKGIGSIMAVRLFMEEDVMGALNLYSRRPRAFTTENVEKVLIYQTHASTALATARTVTGLKNALDSRHEIGMAQGILMHRYGMSRDSAFEVLKRYSSHTNVKLRNVAQQVSAVGGLPNDAAASA